MSPGFENGPPIHWYGKLLRIQAANDRAARALADHPGEFLTAIGLGLQGLDRGAVGVSLKPPESGNVLARIALLPFFRRQPGAAWGLDLGSHAFKAAKLVAAPGGEVAVEEAHYQRVESPPHGQENDHRVAAELADWKSRHDLAAARIVGSISGNLVLGRFFELPPMPGKKVPSAVTYEARRQLPVDLASLCWNWTELTSREAASGAHRRIMVVAARKWRVQQRLEQFAAAGIRLDVLQSDCVALHSALRYDACEDEPPSGQALAALDVGASKNNLVVSSNREVWFRSFGLTTHDDKGASIQHAPHDSRSEQLAAEVARSLTAFGRRHPDVQVARLFVLGGGARSLAAKFSKGSSHQFAASASQVSPVQA